MLSCPVYRQSDNLSCWSVQLATHMTGLRTGTAVVLFVSCVVLLAPNGEALDLGWLFMPSCQ
jgi:hypothetical protein